MSSPPRPAAGWPRRITDGEAGTEAVGAALAAALEPGDLLALHGELGAGKTRLVRGLAAGLGVRPEAVRSPTFVLHHVYRGGRVVLHHLDLYRLGEGADLRGLDLESLLDGGAVAIEWAELGDLSGLDPVHLTLEERGTQLREIAIDPAAPARLLDAFASTVPGRPG
ncbi:MAG: tRNA (adenosine(37)-N6)-threonylcarbamoyltransferase complex ATPase subunit type 1 TsaE [Chloroflexi bacterium]|nr:MAG: tRNA (adenosine(37)-N6)-threonylcarbamoyltransferase complex ATPase subunit type 1 TsaE [Chloroflexota bacterium]